MGLHHGAQFFIRDWSRRRLAVSLPGVLIRGWAANLSRYSAPLAEQGRRGRSEDRRFVSPLCRGARRRSCHLIEAPHLRSRGANASDLRDLMAFEFGTSRWPVGIPSTARRDWIGPVRLSISAR
jgi:hypothetical protein